MSENIKKYSIIYQDPAWYYPQRNNKKTKFGGGVTNKYPVMKLDEIKKIPIPDISEDNCAMFMWVTTASTSDSNLQDKLDLFKYWGFRCVNIGFTWIKTNPKSGTPFFGVGYYTKSNAEHCFLGIKGKMKPISNSVSSLIISPREAHSKKPDETRDRIVELFGDIPRAELFARQSVSGWDCFGNEIDGKDIRLMENK